MLLDLGDLNMDLRGSQKNPSLICISDWDQPVQGPVSGHRFGDFLQQVSTNIDLHCVCHHPNSKSGSTGLTYSTGKFLVSP